MAPQLVKRNLGGHRAGSVNLAYGNIFDSVLAGHTDVYAGQFIICAARTVIIFIPNVKNCK